MVHFIMDAVKALDLSQARTNQRGTGHAQYPPSMKLGLLIYSYATGTFASRRIEALIGAVYLDSGPGPAAELVLRLFESEIGNMVTSPEERNPKGELQEHLQSIHPQAPVYQIVSESGPDHRRVFQSEVSWRDLVLATGKGKSKKEAEARAASEALRSRLWEA